MSSVLYLCNQRISKNKTKNTSVRVILDDLSLELATLKCDDQYYRILELRRTIVIS
jgi:hypothetical protein